MKKSSRIFRVIFLLYLAYLFYLVFLSKYYGRATFHRTYNVMPFNTIMDFLRYSRSIRAIAINIGGNILAFVPMGFLAPGAFKGLRKFGNAVVLILFFAFSIEIAQYIAGVGACDIDDVMLNLLGGMLGYLMFKAFYK